MNWRNNAARRHADPDLFVRPAPPGQRRNQAMQDNGLVVQVRREQAGHAVITVAGEIDIATVPGLRQRLSALADDGRPLIADLDQVTFIDATGLGALISAAYSADSYYPMALIRAVTLTRPTSSPTTPSACWTCPARDRHRVHQARRPIVGQAIDTWQALRPPSPPPGS